MSNSSSCPTALLPGLKSLNPSGCSDILEWLVGYDRKPRLMPRFPESGACALVAAALVAERPCAWLLDEESQVQVLRDGLKAIGGELPVLFFHVPRTIV